MSKALSISLKVLSFPALFLFCKAFSYELARPGKNPVPSVLLAFGVAGLIHLLTSLLFCNRRGEKTGLLGNLIVLLVVVAIRAVTSMYSMDGGDTGLGIALSILKQLPLIVLFHGAIQAISYFLPHFKSTRPAPAV